MDSQVSWISCTSVAIMQCQEIVAAQDGCDQSRVIVARMLPSGITVLGQRCVKEGACCVIEVGNPASLLCGF